MTGGRRLVGVAARPRRRRTLDYAFSLDGGDPRPDPRSAWQPHGVHGPSRTFDPTRVPWARRELAGTRGGAACSAAVVYELHVGTFTPEGTLDAARRPARPPRRARRRRRRADAGRRLRRRVGLGLRRRRPVCRARRLRRPGGPAAVRRRLPRARPRRRASTSSTTTSGRAELPRASSGPTSPRRTTRRGAPAVNLDDDGSAEVRRCVIDNALRWFRDFHVDALRLDAVHELATTREPHVLAELSDDVAALAATSVGRSTSIAESDLNDPVMVTPDRRGRPGHDGAVGRRRPPRAPRRADRRDATATTPTSPVARARDEAGPLSVLAKTLTRGVPARRPHSTFRGRVWGAPVDVGPRGPGSSPTCRPTTRSATGPPATGSRRRSRRALQAVGAALVPARALHADGLHG